ncbi:MAG: dicarboxylate/amino acid:cation symporter [Candidatus Paraimprobicoccus trichonymphae]|uniref:Dicarboxylate/amino acid:cation symporter n=1 Tax=Candidatus Paraimprobicoccus trichonymphae TaxID=3033793 RepID=A0AA48HZM3_9FIRM|nr:MAG: dicarboxylate/amino acid:cation symporter [Candidatus Paraimprobicoccus trichonymphae]
MKENFKKYSLLLKIFLSIILGILIGIFMPKIIVDVFININILIGKLINFFVPLIILGYVINGVSSLGKNSNKSILITVVVSYLSMIFSAFFSYFAVKNIFFIKYLNIKNIKIDISDNNIKNNIFSQINIAPIMSVMSALFLAFIIGIGISSIKSEYLKKLSSDFHNIVEKLVKKVMIPLIPFYIIGTFTKISSSGQIYKIITTFSVIIMCIVIIQTCAVLFLFLVASITSKSNFFVLIKNTLPAYFVALGTQSSVSTIPVSIECAKKNKISESFVNFVIPFCTTLHFCGSAISIMTSSTVIILSNNIDVNFKTISIFISVFGLLLTAVPGVPAGAVFAVSEILKSALGFNPDMISLIVSIHLMQDSFGTACNVSGSSALSVIINSIHSKKLSKI